jgi:hypothetical protein
VFAWIVSLLRQLNCDHYNYLQAHVGSTYSIYTGLTMTLEKLLTWLFPTTIACIKLKARGKGWIDCEDNAYEQARIAGPEALEHVWKALQ